MKKIIAALLLLISPALADDMPLLHVGQGASTGYVPPPPGAALMASNGSSFVFASNGTSHICLSDVASCGSASCAASAAFFSRADTEANIAAAEGAGAPGISTWETQVTSLICGQVSGGTWSLKDDEYLFTAPTLALAEENLVSTSYTLVPQASVTFAANAGLTGAANSTGYADTGYTPASGQMTATSSMLGVCMLNNRTSQGSIANTVSELGTGVTNNDYRITLLAAGSNFTNIYNGGSIDANYASWFTGTQGGAFTSRTSTSSFVVIHNGSVVTTAGANPSVGVTGLPDFWVLGFDNNGALGGGEGSPDTIGVAVLGATETNAQIFADEALYSAAISAIIGSSYTC